MLGVGGGGNKSVKFVNRGRVSQIPSGLRNAVPWIFFDHFPIIFQDDPTFVLMIPQNDLRGGGIAMYRWMIVNACVSMA